MVYNVEKVKCPKCSNTWFTNILSQVCLSRGCSQKVDYTVHRAPATEAKAERE